MSKLNRPHSILISLLGAIMIFLSPALEAKTFAIIQSPTPGPVVSFAFDDGYASALTQAAPILAKYGFTGTDYIATGCVGMTKAPNACRANNDATYMDWNQITQLKNAYQWEIGSHTVTHPYLASSDAADGQANQLTQAQVVQELSQSKADLAAHGINATSLATPYGDYNNSVLAQIAKYYSSQRGFADTGYNSWPYSDYLLRVQQVQGRLSVNTVKAYINTAVANNQWLILVFHNIKTAPSKNSDDYEYASSNLDKIAAYVKSKNIPVANISSALAGSDVNMLPNATFNAGIADGWRTDALAAITADDQANGSYPDPAKSVKLTSAVNSSVHLFSPPVSIDPNANYMLKNFLNVQKNTGGEVAFYIDEYDGFGNWISGQYKAAERSAFVESVNFKYTPSSVRVAKASLQVIVTATASPGDITAYLDNCQWYPLSLVNISPPPASVSLLPNFSFDDGIADGWRTDNSISFNSDGLNNGSPANPQNSIRINGATVNTHLFSPVIPVNPASVYNIQSYLDIRQLSSGEVAYYVDEYSVSGNWISGQYITGIRSVGKGTVTFSYKPSSANVAKASLQIIQVANSNVIAYFDDVVWIQNQ